MSDFRPYNRKREIIKLDLVQPGDYTDSVLVCVPKFAYDVARSLLGHYGKWRSTYAAEYLERFYRIPDSAEFDIIEASIDKFLGSRDMSCNLVDALENINETLRQSACCGSAGSGQVIDDNFYYGSQLPLEVPASFGLPEDDFETEEAYNLHKCEAANAIVSGVVSALNSWSLLTLASLTSGAVVVGLIAAFFVAPPLAAFLALAATGLAFGALSSVASAIDDNREDLVCLLYASDTATEAYDVFSGAVSDLVLDVGFVEIEMSAIVALIMQTVPIDAINALFSATGLPAISDGTSCDGCLCVPFEVAQGVVLTPPSLNVQSVTVVSGRQDIYFSFPCAIENGVGVTVSPGDIVTLAGTIGGATLIGVRFWDSAGSLIYSDNYNYPSVALTDVGAINLVGPAQFRVSFDGWEY